MDKSEHFSRDELQCRFSQNCEMDEEFMTVLEEVRKSFGKPMRLSSAYRSQDHPIERVKKSTGMHAKGRAVDVLVHGGEALDLLQVLMKHPYVQGIGLSQSGLHAKRFIHMDNRETPAIWTY